ncbi:hypothetical protein GE21DRAFT_1336323 [Neurospora crassa]|nr:hypothetical protein GE21DRAFT_1336323 [Neurospora crassa]
MSPPPHGPRHRGYHSYNNNNPDSNSNCSAPPTPPGSIPSPSLSFPGSGSAPNSSSTTTTTTITSTNPSNSNTSLNNMTHHHANLHVPSTQSQQSTTTSGTDRTATAHAATTLLTTLFPPYSQTNQLIASLSAELDALKARQRIWKRLAHAAVLFSSDHELRYSLLDKCNDLAECMKMYPRLREEVAKMNEVELQLFSISSTAKQLVGDVEWVRAEDVRGFVEGVRRGQLQIRGNQKEGGNRGDGNGIQNGRGDGNGNQIGEGEGIIDGKGTGGMVQVKLDKGRGDVGRRLNYLMVTSGSGSASAGQGQSQNHQGSQAGTQVGGGGGGGGQGEQEDNNYNYNHNRIRKVKYKATLPLKQLRRRQQQQHQQEDSHNNNNNTKRNRHGVQQPSVRNQVPGEQVQGQVRFNWSRSIWTQPSEMVGHSHHGLGHGPTKEVRKQ